MGSTSGEWLSATTFCYDRVVVTGTLPGVCYAERMTRFLYANKVRIVDYPQYAATLRDAVRACAAAIASEAGIAIEHIRNNHVRKEAVVAKVIEGRGGHPGLVHVISAMEACDAYKPWHDKSVGEFGLRELAKGMVQGDFGDAESAIAVGFRMVSLALLLRPSTTPLENCFLALK
jgi:hypothetical protein